MPVFFRDSKAVVAMTHLAFLVVVISPLGAQVPEGWYATTSFQFCGGRFGSASGRVLIIDPETREQVEVEGLPDDLRSVPCNGDSQGGASILISPGGDVLIVGERTAAGEALEIYVLELDGSAVVHTDRFRVGTGTWPANEVAQMAFLDDGRILFATFGLGGRGLGVLDPDDPDQPVRLFGKPANALAVDLEKEVAYFAVPDDDQRPFSSSTIFGVSIPELLHSNDPEDWTVASVPMLLESLAMSPDGNLLAVGDGAQSGLFVIDPVGGEVGRLCTDIPDSLADSAAMIVDTRREEIVVHFGGPVNNRGLSSSVVAFRIEDGGCSAERRGMSSIGVHGALSGIAVSTGSPVPGPAFVRGDCNGDGAVDISDAVSSLDSLFLGGEKPGCDDACDSNDSGDVDISDAISTLGVLFLGNGIIPLPGMTVCGQDPTTDELGCETFSTCQEPGSAND